MLPRSQGKSSRIRFFIAILTIQLHFYNFDCFMISAESFWREAGSIYTSRFSSPNNVM